MKNTLETITIQQAENAVIYAENSTYIFAVAHLGKCWYTFAIKKTIGNTASTMAGGDTKREAIRRAQVWATWMGI